MTEKPLLSSRRVLNRLGKRTVGSVIEFSSSLNCLSPTKRPLSKLVRVNSDSSVQTQNRGRSPPNKDWSEHYLHKIRPSENGRGHRKWDLVPLGTQRDNGVRYVGVTRFTFVTVTHIHTHNKFVNFFFFSVFRIRLKVFCLTQSDLIILGRSN